MLTIPSKVKVNITMKQQILDLIQSKPKHYSRMIQNNNDLKEWVLSNTVVKSSNFAELIYSALTKESNKCSNNNTKKFKSIKDGYMNCGRANKCQCTKDQVSKNVKKTKSLYTQEQIDEINIKRINTTKNKYGVTNNGQIKKALITRKALYKNQERIKEITQKNKKTKKERYGNENYNNRDKAEATYLEKTGFNNPQQNPEVSKKSQITKKERYEPYHLAKMNYNSFVKNTIENFELTPLLSKEEYIGVGTRPKINFECLHCGHTFIKRFDYASPPKCKICYPTVFSYQSKGEQEVYEYCKTLAEQVEHSNRTIINPYEVDIYLPDHNLAIEYNGLYWHSEKGGKKSWNYHYRKYRALEDKGIQLLSIYSDEWDNKKDILKSIIRQKIGYSNKRYYARKLTLKKVVRKDAMVFINTYHLQGAPTQIPLNYGLYNDNELVSVMSFKQKNNRLELIRFCSHGNVVGGASKLLKACRTEHKDKHIVSFSNNRYSDGNLYKVLGFDLDGEVPPMQEYVYKYLTRTHKLSAPKILKESIRDNKTEWQLMQELGYDRIWDCGKKRWLLK